MLFMMSIIAKATSEPSILLLFLVCLLNLLGYHYTKNRADKNEQ